MTSITTQDVQHLARLSNLQLSDSETEALRGDIERILAYIELLSELDTSGVEPTYQVSGLENVWRDDVIEYHAAGRERLLGLSEDVYDMQIKVPKVL